MIPQLNTGVKSFTSNLGNWLRETGGAASRDRKEKLTSPLGRMSGGKKIALTEIRAGGGRMWGLAEVLQWDM